MKTTKDEVLEFCKNPPSSPEEKFNQAFGLYRNSEGSMFAQVRYLNAAGFSNPNLDNLMYDLKKIHGISDADIRSAKMKDVPKPPVCPYVIPTFSKGLQGSKERAEFCEKNGITVADKKHATYDAAIAKWVEEKTAEWQADQEATKTEDVVIVNKEDIDVVDAQELPVTKEEVFQKAPDQVKEYVSLHDEFPFLDSEDCPDELKILVADKRMHYRKYVNANSKLLVVANESGAEVPMTDEQIYDLAVQAVENYQANQAIYAELDHYKKEGSILGKHPIFATRKLVDAVSKMTMADAAKRKTNLESYIRRDSKSLENDMDEDKMKDLQKKIEGWKEELALVNAKLGVKE